MKLFERMLVLVFMYMDVTFVLGGWGVQYLLSDPRLDLPRSPLSELLIALLSVAFVVS